jgi:hypothetical protein
MLTPQLLQQMLIDSAVAQQFFHDAQMGFFFNNQYHDLFFDKLHDTISSLTSFSDRPPLHPKHEQMIMRIHGDEPSQYVWPDLDFKEFVSECLPAYEQFFHQGLSTQQDSQEQQPAQHHQKGLFHIEELEL